MKIKKIINSQAEQFLQQNFSSPTHWPDWNILVEKFYNSKFFYLGAFDNKELIGVFPLHLTSHKRFLDRLQSGQFKMIPNGGWIFSKKQKLSQAFFPVKWNQSMEIFGLPAVPEFNTDIKDFDKTKKTLVIDLGDTIDEIWKNSVHSKRRNMIRKAEKEGITIEKVTAEDELDDFYRLYIEASARFTKNPLELSFFKELFFQTKNIAFSIFTANKDGKQIANVGVISDKNYSIYWLGNNAMNMPNFGQGDLLQWYTIKQMKEKGCKYYDLCYIEPEKLPHIYKFKKGFSNTETPIYFHSQKSLFFRISNKFLK